MKGEAPITPALWARAEAVFARAVDLPPADRTALLDEATRDDAELRLTVDRLLVQHDSDPAFLEASPPWLDNGNDSEPIPSVIDDYRILREVGRGGMGRVYLAERIAPAFRRQVALKVMHRGMDTDDLLRRFHSERQILAGLDHPNIARLLDVGATQGGLPYFVMDYIEGLSILEHCDHQRLTIAERIDLLRTVCSAVQHAHQNLVVHRDLKPGNILVTADGIPKLLDFGIAKILDREPGRVLTRVEQRLLTPEYSAPEQFRGGPVTTACDVYALGVLLHELLTGTHPYGAVGEDIDPSRRILAQDPLPPSVAQRNDPNAAEHAAARGETPESLRRTLTGDLNAIVGKAIHKDPKSRYTSAAGLAEDLRRYRESLPVEARPPGAAYQMRKFIGRHRLAVGAGVVLFALLSGFGAVTAYQARQISLETAHIAHERDKALAVQAFLLETFGTRGPNQAVGGGTTVRELLDKRSQTLKEAYPNDTELRAELTGVLAQAYQRLGLYAAAEPLAQTALDQQRALHGSASADVASALDTLGWIQRQRDQLPQAEQTLREAVRTGRVAFASKADDRLATALNDLGAVEEARGEYANAAREYRASLDVRRRLSGDSNLGVAVTLSNLSVVLYRRGDFDGAVSMARRAVDTFTRLLGADHERTIIALGNLAAFRAAQGDHRDAAATYADILARDRRVFGSHHPQVSYALTGLANELIRLNRSAEAKPLLLEALGIEREAFGPRHERVAYTLRVLGDVENTNGRPAEALGHYIEALGIVRERLGPRHKEAAALHLRIGKVHQAMGKTREAERDYRAAVTGFRAALGPRHYLTTGATLTLAEFLLNNNRTVEARGILADVSPAVAALHPASPKLAHRLAADKARASLGEAGTPRS